MGDGDRIVRLVTKGQRTLNKKFRMFVHVWRTFEHANTDLWKKNQEYSTFEHPNIRTFDHLDIGEQFRTFEKSNIREIWTLNTQKFEY